MAAAFSPSSLFALPNSAAISSGKPNKGDFFLGRRRSSISWPLIHRHRGNSYVSPVAVPTWPDVPTPDEAPRSANTDFFVTSDETLSVHAGCTQIACVLYLATDIVQVPDLAQLQNLVNRLKNVGDLLAVAITQYGDLHLQLMLQQEIRA